MQQRGRTVNQAEVTLIHILKQPLTPEVLEQRFIVFEGCQIRNNRFVRYDKLPRMHCAINGCLDALLEVGDQVACIATENFISSLAPEDDFTMPAGQLRHHVLWKRPRTSDWVVEMVDHVADMRDEIIDRDVNIVKFKTA